MQSNTNEVTHCVFITSILNASLAIVINEEKIYIAYRKDVSADQAFRSDDYDLTKEVLKEDIESIRKEEMMDIVMNEYRFLLHKGHNYILWLLWKCPIHVSYQEKFLR
ncbi:hypothetical protein Glove_35g7 [Diversispora epigaea]|uniref:Uncharacterized protein n=1 Tax=Diversispora epigaea TaxID=1348612 RepID=A0A397JJF3_9GLOM|nr:hypothetical protein Glove_35g7 [Diversispora epigaea]